GPPYPPRTSTYSGTKAFQTHEHMQRIASISSVTLSITSRISECEARKMQGISAEVSKKPRHSTHFISERTTASSMLTRTPADAISARQHVTNVRAVAE